MIAKKNRNGSVAASRKAWGCGALVAVGLMCAGEAAADGFAAAVTPPRFEVTATPGTSRRHVIEIINVARAPSTFTVRTADWSLAEDATVTFYDRLQPGSCRPWVAIERTRVTVPANGRLRYRFDVAPPADAAAGECRFALLIEGDEPAVTRAGGLTIPVSGRIGVVVYVAVGDVAPKLEIVAREVVPVNGKPMAALRVRNTGTAHGRISGFLSGRDAAGRELDFEPSSFPVLPGETRLLTLAAQEGRERPADPVFPVTVRGTLEWGEHREPFEHRFEAPAGKPTTDIPPPRRAVPSSVPGRE